MHTHTHTQTYSPNLFRGWLSVPEAGGWQVLAINWPSGFPSQTLCGFLERSARPTLGVSPSPPPEDLTFTPTEGELG